MLAGLQGVALAIGVLAPCAVGLSVSAKEQRGINVCYFTNWARYRGGLINTGDDVFEMGLDADLCTHFMYGFATVTADFDIESNDPNADHPTGHAAQDGLCPEVCNDPAFKADWSDSDGERCDWPCSPTRTMRGYEGATVGMKRKNPDIKVLISVGGWNFNDCAASAAATVGQGTATCEIFSNIASSEAGVRAFARNVIAFCRRWGFDGFDLDWEYPVVAGHNSNAKVDGKFVDQIRDYQNYIAMLRLMKEEFAAEAGASGRRQLLLTAAVGVGLHTAETAYDIPGMSQHLDLINLMTYDLHGGWESRTGCNANLYATDVDVSLGGGVGAGQAVEGYPLSVSWAVDYWIEHGASPAKLTMGLATYGRGWRLADPSNTSYNAPASGACEPGPSTKEAGYRAFYEIQDLLESGAATAHYDEERECPYVVTTDGEWIGYDNERSLLAKVEFAKQRKLAGTMVWALDLDDFAGRYGDGSKYPLIRVMRLAWSGDAPVVPTPSPISTTRATTQQPTETSSTTPAPTQQPAETPSPTAATPAPSYPPTSATSSTTQATGGGTTTSRSQPPASGGVCVHNTDCDASAWCSQADTYVSWCKAHDAAACPSPQCVLSGTTAEPVAPSSTTEVSKLSTTPVGTTAKTTSTSTTTATTATTSTIAPTTAATTTTSTSTSTTSSSSTTSSGTPSTASSTASSTAAEAPEPIQAPSQQPTSPPTAGGEPGGLDCARSLQGVCLGCLASDNVCWPDQPQSWCSAWSSYKWCAGEPSLAQSRRAQARRHSFLGPALLQTAVVEQRVSSEL